jgi:serine/threonine protein kinase
MEYRGNRYVLKKTKRELCDLTALQLLRRTVIQDRVESTTVTLVTPLEIWEEGDRISELYAYYDGEVLHQVVARNKYPLRGEYLGRIYTASLKALRELHTRGVLHRDLTPSNLLIMPSGDIAILDPSFCCMEDAYQVPVQNRDFSPPEQAKGQACKQSDWFSLAATIFFLANARPPRLDDREALEAGLCAIDLGDYGYTHIGGEAQLFESLLESDVKNRPVSYSEIEPFGGSRVVCFGLEGVLDLGRLGWLILSPQSCGIAGTEDAKRILQGVLDGTGGDDSLFGIPKEILPELRRDVQSFLAGNNPWLK